MNQVKRAGVSAGSFIPGSGVNEKSRISQMKAQKKAFEELGFGEIFNDMAAGAAGITPTKAASFLDPLTNTEFKKIVAKDGGKGKAAHVFTHLGDKEMDKLASTVRPEDNVLSMMYDLRKNNISVEEFRDKLTEPRYYDKLTSRQKRELNQEAKNSLLDDILFETF